MTRPGAKVAHSGITRKFRFKGQEIIFERGEMGTVYDTHGFAYTDLVMGYGPVILGHGYPAFQEKLIAHLGHGILMPGYTSLHETYLARLLRYRPNQQGAFFKTASEAVTAAFRAAAMETGKLGIIRCGYVGWHDAQIAGSIKWHDPLHSPLRQSLRYTRAMRGIGPEEPVINWVDLQLDSLHQIIAENRDKLGCFIFDAYLASFTDRATLEAAIEICHEAGLIVVFDETKTGARISRLGYADDNELDADLIVFGKALANGAPLSILIGKEHLMDYAEKARLSGTFSKELFAVYAGLATLDVMEEGSDSFENGWDEVAHIGRKFASVICAASQEAGLSEHLWAQPVLGGGMFELCHGDFVLPKKDLRGVLLLHLAENGILLLEGHPSFVCLAHRDTEWDQFHASFVQALKEWGKHGGFSS